MEEEVEASVDGVIILHRATKVVNLLRLNYGRLTTLNLHGGVPSQRCLYYGPDDFVMHLPVWP